ncbi:DEAD/DEAH box helicase family protein [Saccharolobus caldissimus]|uniref:Type I restriction endonuclease subunit R n=1 Tax=Saccharolobus caldissimus TaxID=1702097 RepID=A0AAQ4CWU6_9CREN|nr:DEAD/DEAH box helicase family protein [Saccharolobus caldissimus]BDC00278.1 type I restriction endonuclease subunit R [Saccharolobus caldissimus]
MPDTEADAITLIDEHLRNLGWDLKKFRKNHSLKQLFPTINFSEKEGKHRPDYTLIQGDKVILIEAKKKGVDLRAAIAEARESAKILMKYGVNVPFIYASDGEKWYMQNLQSNTIEVPVERFLKPEEIEVTLDPISSSINTLDLRYYQKIAVQQIITSFLSGKKRMLVEMATGTGKTEVAMAAIAKLLDEGKVKKVLYLVDRDSLASQTYQRFNARLGDRYIVRKFEGDFDDISADVVISTIQMLYVGDKYKIFSPDHFQLIVLDEAHRSYYGDWHVVVQYFNNATVLGLTATPKVDKDVDNFRYFGYPIFRYTYSRGVKDGYLADTIYYKFLTNVDIYGIHDLGYDFDPDDLGKKVDIPMRNELIAEKYFEAIKFKENKELKKAIVFAASIKHAENLRLAFIKKYNELMGYSLDNAESEELFVSIHSGIPNHKELVSEFQSPNSRIKVAFTVDLLSTGIDAPDVEAIVMARPTKSRILYLQMKGRGTRIYKEGDKVKKDKFILIDFVDSWRLEKEEDKPITNEDIMREEEEEEKEIQELTGETEVKEEKQTKRVGEKKQKEEQMIILDIPVTIVYSEVIAPEVKNELKGISEQVVKQVKDYLLAQEEVWIKKTQFETAVRSFDYFYRKKGNNKNIDENYLNELRDFLSAQGITEDMLKDIYGEADASFKDFVEVALGQKSFPTPEERKRNIVKEWYIKKGYPKECEKLFMALYDFRKRNPNIDKRAFFEANVVKEYGGLRKVKECFKDINSFWKLYDDVVKEIG